MTLPALPPIPENPPAIVRPAPPSNDVPPATITLQPSTSSSDLKQTNTNTSNSNSTAVVENTNVNVITQTAPNVAVGDIYYQAPHAYINAYANSNDWGVVGGVQIPLGGGKVRKAAGELARLRVANYKLSTCAAVAGMDIEAVAAMAPEYAVCAGKKRTAKVVAPDHSDELATLRAELADMKAKLASYRQAPNNDIKNGTKEPGIRGMW